MSEARASAPAPGAEGKEDDEFGDPDIKVYCPYGVRLT